MGDASTDQSAPSPSIWTLLADWAKTLRPWQQYVLGKAVRHSRLTDEQIDTAYGYFKRDHKLLDDLPEGTEAIEAIGARPVQALSADLLLTSVENILGVNALPPGTGLTFGPQLTLVYGRNGAGKSGFVRLLANACFCRYQPDLIPDIYAEQAQPPPSAQFQMTLDGKAKDPLQFTVGHEDPFLKRFTVFDSTVARHLLTQIMSFEFKPAGFDVFPEMVRVYKKLTLKLESDISRHTRQNTFSTAFIGGTTPVQSAVSTLGPATDVAKLRELGKFGPAETARVKELDKLLVALRSQSPKEALEVLAEAKTDVTGLRATIAKLAGHFGEDKVAARKALVEAAETADALAKTLGADQFKQPFFNAVGTPEWEQFAGKAHALARKEREDYPADGDRCLLCEQPLGEEARSHLEALFEFVEGDATRSAETAKAAVDAAFNTLTGESLDHFSEAARVRTHVRRLAPPLEQEVQTTFETLVAAKTAALADLEDLKVSEQPIPLPPVLELLDRLLERMEADKEKLSADDKEASITAMDSERLVLRHREVLARQLPQIETYVGDEKWRSKATIAKGSLAQRPITDKEKECFATVVGDSYRTRFGEECAGFKCKVPVEMQTMGRDGSTVRTMALPGGFRTIAILSEGEQRAIALADFLTEVSVNPAIAGLILDDPVNSQDHYRMKQIAARLVDEAGRRQVIVFTHSLPFLNAMFVAAEDAGIAVEPHQIDRDLDGKPGLVTLGDAPVTMKAYDNTDKAKAHLVAAKALTGSKQVDEIRAGMGALRRTIEETVVKKLFKDVVPRWEDRVIVTALRKVIWDDAQVEKLCLLFEDLSAFVEGHSHTDEAMGAMPEVTDLEERIAEIEALIRWAKPNKPKPVPASA